MQPAAAAPPRAARRLAAAAGTGDASGSAGAAGTGATAGGAAGGSGTAGAGRRLWHLGERRQREGGRRRRDRGRRRQRQGRRPRDRWRRGQRCVPGGCVRRCFTAEGAHAHRQPRCARPRRVCGRQDRLSRRDRSRRQDIDEPDELDSRPRTRCRRTTAHGRRTFRLSAECSTSITRSRRSAATSRASDRRRGRHSTAAAGPTRATSSARTWATNDNWNAIDPNIVVDDAGVPWMDFGSFWSGIKMVKLNTDGTRADTMVYDLASGPGGGAVEGPFIFKRCGYYYLFVSFGSCCSSPYNYTIRVGRSATVTGPYIDKEGMPLMKGRRHAAGSGELELERARPQRGHRLRQPHVQRLSRARRAIRTERNRHAAHRRDRMGRERLAGLRRALGCSIVTARFVWRRCRRVARQRAEGKSGSRHQLPEVVMFAPANRATHSTGRSSLTRGSAILLVLTLGGASVASGCAGAGVAPEGDGGTSGGATATGGAATGGKGGGGTGGAAGSDTAAAAAVAEAWPETRAALAAAAATRARWAPAGTAAPVEAVVPAARSVAPRGGGGGTAGGGRGGGTAGATGGAGRGGAGAGGATSAGATIVNDTFWKDTAGDFIYSQGGGVLRVGDTYYWYGVRYAGAVTLRRQSHGQEQLDWLPGQSRRTLPPTSSTGSSRQSRSPRTRAVGSADSGSFITRRRRNTSWSRKGAVASTSPPADCARRAVRLQQRADESARHRQRIRRAIKRCFRTTTVAAYLVASSSSGRSNRYLSPLRASDFLAAEQAIPVYSGGGREGNCMFKYSGTYYYCSSDLHGWNSSQSYCVSSSSVRGPWSAEFVLDGTQPDYSHVTQTGFFISVQGTQATTIIFAGDRWSDFAGNGLGFNQWMPITFNGKTPQLPFLQQMVDQRQGGNLGGRARQQLGPQSVVRSRSRLGERPGGLEVDGRTEPRARSHRTVVMAAQRERHAPTTGRRHPRRNVHAIRVGEGDGLGRATHGQRVRRHRLGDAHTGRRRASRTSNRRPSPSSGGQCTVSVSAGSAQITLDDFLLSDG